MKIVFKLYASLSNYLPPEADGNVVEIEVDDNASPIQIMTRHKVPAVHIHLVLVNGVWIPPEDRDNPLSEGDELAVWPPVAGG
jgi:molybdopterin converting factor small subunit